MSEEITSVERKVDRRPLFIIGGLTLALLLGSLGGNGDNKAELNAMLNAKNALQKLDHTYNPADRAVLIGQIQQYVVEFPKISEVLSSHLEIQAVGTTPEDLYTYPDWEG